MSNELSVITDRLTTARNYIVKLCGTVEAPIKIVDDSGLHSAQENIETLRQIKKEILDFWKPVKQAAKEPYDKALAQEKKWLESVDSVFNYADAKVREYNNTKRIELQQAEQAASDARAAAEKVRLEAESEKLKTQGLEQAAMEKVAEAEAVMPVFVPEVLMKSRSDMNTVTEKKEVVFFKIINHEEFAAALMGSGKGSMITLDKKTETAFKKYLDSNESMADFPGVEFQRDYVNNYRTKRSV